MAERTSVIAQYASLLQNLDVPEFDIRRNTKNADPARIAPIVSECGHIGLDRVDELFRIGQQTERDHATLARLETMGDYGISVYTVCSEAVNCMNGLLNNRYHFVTLSDLVHPQAEKGVSFVGAYELSERMNLQSANLGSGIAQVIHGVVHEGESFDKAICRLDESLLSFDHVVNRQQIGWRWFVPYVLLPSRRTVDRYYKR